MSSSRRHFLGLTLAAASLSGCGFAPVYGTSGAGSRLQNQIRPDDPDTRDGFVFVAQFEERLGRADLPQYRLSYAISTRSAGVGVTPTAETTRYNLFGAVNYTLTDSATGDTVTSGAVETFTGYSASRFIVSTQSVERDASDRLMKILADQVITRLVSTAPDWAS